MAGRLSLLGAGRQSIAAKGWWSLDGVIPAANCIAAYQPKGAVSASASYVNLANPGNHDCTVGIAPDFNAATGWSFSQVTQSYLITDVIPENDQTWSMIVKFSGMSTTTALVGCEYGTNARFYIFPRRATVDNYLLGNGGYLATGVRLTSGILAIAGANGYLNGNLVGQMNATWQGTGRKILIGSVNISQAENGVTPNNYCDATIPAMAIYDIDISSYMPALNAAIDAL